MLISLRSGGLPSAPKSKKWIDKVDLAVALRDVLINEGIENNGVDPDKFHNLFTIGVHSFSKFNLNHNFFRCILIISPIYLILDYNYNVYGLDWKTQGIWRLSLLQKVKLPSSINNLPVIEQLIISLLRIEVRYLCDSVTVFYSFGKFTHFFFNRKLCIVCGKLVKKYYSISKVMSIVKIIIVRNELYHLWKRLNNSHKKGQRVIWWIVPLSQIHYSMLLWKY